MKPKTLANILIKILGLSLIAHGIPGLVNGLVGWLQYSSDNRLHGIANFDLGAHFGTILLMNLIPFVVGFALIAASRWFVEILFKDELE